MSYIIIYLTGVVASFFTHIIINMFNDELTKFIEPFCIKMEIEEVLDREALSWIDYWNDMKFQVLLSWIGIALTVGFYILASLLSLLIRITER